MEIWWPLVFFTLFTCLAAGTFAGIGAAAFLSKGEKLQWPGLLTAFGALVLAGVASFLHLEHPSRFFGQFGNIGSGINRELIMIIVVGLVMVWYFVVLRGGKPVSKVVSALAVITSAVLVVVMADSYLMASRPVLDTILLPLYYLAGAAVSGALTLLILSKLIGEEESLSAGLSKGALYSLGALALVTAGYVAHIGSAARNAYVTASVVIYDVGPVQPTDPTAALSRILSGDLALLFWGAVVVLGLALPAAVLLLGKGKPAKTYAGLAGAGLFSALVGGVAFRAILYVVSSTVLKF